MLQLINNCEDMDKEIKQKLDIRDRLDKEKNKRWSTAAIYVDRPKNCFSFTHNTPFVGNTPGKLKKNNSTLHNIQRGNETTKIWLCWEFNGLVNIMNVMLSRSVYLTTIFQAGLFV